MCVGGLFGCGLKHHAIKPENRITDHQTKRYRRKKFEKQYKYETELQQSEDKFYQNRKP